MRMLVNNKDMPSGIPVSDLVPHHFGKGGSFFSLCHYLLCCILPLIFAYFQVSVLFQVNMDEYKKNVYIFF